MDAIKKRAEEISVFIIGSPETDVTELLELLYPDGRLSQEDKAVLEMVTRKLHEYDAGFDNFDHKMVQLKIGEYTEKLHKKDKLQFCVVGVMCAAAMIFAIWNAMDSEMHIVGRIFGIVGTLLATLFSFWACSNVKRQHDNPQTVFEMCCEELGVNDNTERMHCMFQHNIDNIRKFLERRG